MKKINDDKVTLYEPKEHSSKAVIFCHGIFHSEEKPIEEVHLGYLCPHATTISANPSAISLHATYGPTVPTNSKWYNYTLTKVEIHNMDDEAWQNLADSNNIAIAIIIDPTVTIQTVTALKKEKYDKILAIHCREVLEEDNPDWDPFTNRQIELDNESLQVTSNDIKLHYTDTNWEKISNPEKLKEGDKVINKVGYFLIEKIVDNIFTISKTDGL